MTPETAALSREIVAYEFMRDELEAEHFGRWIVVHDEEVFGIYDDLQEAADAAVRNFGRGPFLLRQIGEPSTALPASVMQPVNADS